MTHATERNADENLAFYPIARLRLMRSNGIYLSLASVVFVVLAEHWWGRALAVLALAAGLSLAIWAARRLNLPRDPIYVLSREGIFLHIAGARDVMVPWSEVRDVVTGSVGATVNGISLPGFGKFEGLTMLVVSRAFHDREIHVDSLYRRGPGWSNVFVQLDDQVAIALHHEYLGTDAGSLRRAVQSRWQASRDRQAAC
jgi:hypothetical protein